MSCCYVQSTHVSTRRDGCVCPRWRSFDGCQRIFSYVNAAAPYWRGTFSVFVCDLLFSRQVKALHQQGGILQSLWYRSSSSKAMGGLLLISMRGELEYSFPTLFSAKKKKKAEHILKFRHDVMRAKLSQSWSAHEPPSCYLTFDQGEPLLSLHLHWHHLAWNPARGRVRRGGGEGVMA